jgi:hypothetical protein
MHVQGIMFHRSADGPAQLSISAAGSREEQSDRSFKSLSGMVMKSMYHHAHVEQQTRHQNERSMLSLVTALKHRVHTACLSLSESLLA